MPSKWDLIRLDGNNDRINVLCSCNDIEDMDGHSDLAPRVLCVNLSSVQKNKSINGKLNMKSPLVAVKHLCI